MLTTIRERAQGWIAWVIVFIISIPFALWGINEYFGNQEQVAVAEVNGDEIMLQDYQEVLTRRKANLRQQFGRNIDNQLLESKVFKLRILNEMIGQRLVGEDIRNNNYRISDDQLAAFIRSNENFQQGGRFSQDMYAGALRRNGLSPVAFENSLRNSNIMSQISEGFSRSVIVTDAALDDMVRLEQEKRDIAFINLDVKRFSDQVTVTDAQVKEHYDKNHPSYMTPDSVRVEYIVLSIDELAKQVKPDEVALKALYQEHKEQYVTAEQRRAQHVLLAVDRDDEEEDARVRARAEDLVKQARGGADFAALAKEYSTDTISAEKGGDLGFFERGVMLEAFDNQVFSMQPGDISDPVRTSYGYHIIKLNEIKPETGKSFADVRDEIVKEYSLREAEAQFGQQAEEMQNLVYEQSTSLQPAADALGLKLVESDWITNKGGEGITGKQAFIDAAFSEDVLQEGLNSEVIELDENTLVALRNIGHRPPQLKPFDQVADEIREQLKKDTLQEFAATRVADVVSSLKAGRKSLDEVAGELQLSLLTATDVGRVGKDDLSPGLVKAAFATPAMHASGDAAAGSARLDDNTIVIYAIRKVTPGDPANAAEGVRDQMRTILERRQGSDLFADYEQGLREKADVTIYEDRL
jgi:peptidyl-prolyl cis-trans isomerase D